MQRIVLATNLILTCASFAAVRCRPASLVMFLLFTVGHVSAAQVNLVINGDFETGDLSGWVASGNVSVTASSAYPSGGAHHAIVSSSAIGTPGRLSQSFSIGEPSELSFLYYSKVAPGPAGITYGLTNLDSSSTVVLVETSMLNGSVEDLFDPPDFIPSISHFISVPGNYELFVLATASEGGFSYGELENVALATVPEPSTLALGAFGAIGLAAWGWRRKW